MIAAFVAGVRRHRRGGAAGSGSPRRCDGPAPVPVVSGNVSFYNHSASGRAIAPSPIVAAVGRIDDWSRAMTLRVKAAGSRLVLSGDAGRSSRDRNSHNRAGSPIVRAGPLLPVDFALERQALHAVVELIRQGQCGRRTTSAPAGSRGRRPRCCSGSRAGCDRASISSSVRSHPRSTGSTLFGEAPGYVLEVPPEKLAASTRVLRARGVAAWDIGVT